MSDKSDKEDASGNEEELENFMTIDSVGDVDGNYIFVLLFIISSACYLTHDFNSGSSVKPDVTLNSQISTNVRQYCLTFTIIGKHSLGLR